MAYCVLDLYNIPVLREDKKRLRLHPLVQDSWIFQGHLPDGRSFRPLFFHSIKCSKMNGRTLTNCSQEGNRYQIQRTVLPFCLTYLSEISHVTEQQRLYTADNSLLFFTSCESEQETSLYVDYQQLLIICIVFTTKLSPCLKVLLLYVLYIRTLPRAHKHTHTHTHLCTDVSKAKDNFLFQIQLISKK